MRYQLDLTELTLIELLQVELALNYGLAEIDNFSKNVFRQYLNTREQTVRELEQSISSGFSDRANH